MVSTWNASTGETEAGESQVEASVDCKERFYFLKTQRKEKEKRGEMGGERKKYTVSLIMNGLTSVTFPLFFLSQAGTSTYSILTPKEANSTEAPSQMLSRKNGKGIVV